MAPAPEEDISRDEVPGAQPLEETGWREEDEEMVPAFEGSTRQEREAPLEPVPEEVSREEAFCAPSLPAAQETAPSPEVPAEGSAREVQSRGEDAYREDAPRASSPRSAQETMPSPEVAAAGSSDREAREAQSQQEPEEACREETAPSPEGAAAGSSGREMPGAQSRQGACREDAPCAPSLPAEQEPETARREEAPSPPAAQEGACPTGPGEPASPQLASGPVQSPGSAGAAGNSPEGSTSSRPEEARSRNAASPQAAEAELDTSGVVLPTRPIWARNALRLAAVAEGEIVRILATPEDSPGWGHRVLALPRGAPVPEAARAFRQLARNLHPDGREPLAAATEMDCREALAKLQRARAAVASFCARDDP